MGMPVITPGTITREEAIGDIIESVSMEEKALAHILNAESEKLEAIINLPDTTPEQLLAINQSVKNTINAISRLDMILQAKLDMFNSSICK